jgi:hypothetical protein
MVIVDDISLQKFSNYHNAYLLLLISWVVVPPWLSINYNSLNNQFGNITPTFVVVLIILIGLYSLALRGQTTPGVVLTVRPPKRKETNHGQQRPA